MASWVHWATIGFIVSTSPMFHELLPLSLYLCTSSQVSWILCLDLLLRLLRLLRLRLGQSLGLTCTSRNQKRFHGLCLLQNCIQVWGFLSSKLNWCFIQGCTDLHHVALHGFVCASSSDLPRWTWKPLKACKIQVPPYTVYISVLIQHNSTDWIWLITIFSAMTGLWLLQERNHADLFASSIFALIFARCLRWPSESVPAEHNPSPSSDKPNLLGSVKVEIELVQSNWFGTFLSLCFHGVGTQVTWEAPSRQVC